MQARMKELVPQIAVTADSVETAGVSVKLCEVSPQPTGITAAPSLARLA